MEYNEVLVNQVTNFLKTWNHKDKNPTMYGYLVFVAFHQKNCGSEGNLPCTLSSEEMGETLGVSSRTIKRVVQNCADLGLIKVERTPGKKNKVWINLNFINNKEFSNG